MPWSIILVGACFLLFGVLSRRFACNPGQPAFFPRERADDVLYYFFNTLCYSSIAALLLKWVLTARFGAEAPHALAAVKSGYGAMARLPFVVQAGLILLITDFCQYWLHRAFHGRRLWPFHAIHHGAEEVDWTTTFRVHPVNYLLYTTWVAVLVQLMGFRPEVFFVIAPVNFVHAALVHANLNWTFGPFRYVLASPVFHRWHHVSDPAVRDKNFSPTFPVFDLVFGTFHMPRGELPAGYGAEGVPPHFLGQMAYPFRPLWEWAVKAPKAGLGPSGA